LTILCLNCHSPTSEIKIDPVVASVGSKNLYRSDIEELYPADADSISRLNLKNNFIDNWVRENVLLQEAEKYIANEINIDQLVKDYRSSLLIYNYEERLVKERLDTFISNQQKLEIYEANKSSYLLSSPIVKGAYIQVPIDTPQLKQFKKDWIRQDMEAIINFTRKYKLTSRIFPDTWVTFADFLSIIPENLFSTKQLQSKKSLDREKNGIQYFVKVIDYRDKNDVAPLEYIEDKIEKLILYNRKVTLLKTIKEKLYERDLESKKVKIYE
jgi:hypothetical protein